MYAAPSDDEIRRMARARVGFRTHAIVYALVNLAMILVWYFTMRAAGQAPALSNFWPIWTEIGWGVGLATHGVAVYGVGYDRERREQERLRAKYGRLP